MYSQNAKLMFEKKILSPCRFPNYEKINQKRNYGSPKSPKKCQQKKIFTHHTYISVIRGRSLTKLTRRGGQLVPKFQLFVNVYTAENVNAGGWLVKKSQNPVKVVCERPLTTIPPEQMPTNHRFNKCFFVYT